MAKTKNELHEEIEALLYGLDADTFAKLVCDYFDSNEVEEFVEHIESEGYKRKY